MISKGGGILVGDEVSPTNQEKNQKINQRKDTLRWFIHTDTTTYLYSVKIKSVVWPGSPDAAK